MSGDSIITLTTDFGTSDGYAGAMKGVIFSINPHVTVVDISHHIEPQNIPHAAYVLDRSSRYFPQNTVHVAVVDPGVGTDRKAVILRTARAFYVAPDNGILSYLVGDSVESVAIENQAYWLDRVSSTFHGRDVFAPVAAHLSLGVPLHEFGATLTSLVTLPLPHPETGADGALMGHIIHIDHFGNLITDVKRGQLPSSPLRIEVKGSLIEGLSSTYADRDGLVALIGSDDYLEIGLKDGNAATLLGARFGDRIEIRAGSRST